MVISRYYGTSYQNGNINKETLYNLLPSIYRQREIESNNFILKAFLSIIADHVAILEDDISNLYDNWFIESCDEWVVPYIADLFGIEGFHSRSEAFITQRAFVANTIKYRRSKGTANTLEQMAYDITRWGVKVVEFFKLLNTTVNVNHLSSDYSTVDLRDTSKLMFVNTPFDGIHHMPDIRNNKEGYYNIQNVGVFLWRLKSYPVKNSPAYAHGKGRFTFDQLGNNVQLFTDLDVLQERNDNSGGIKPPVTIPISREMCVPELILDDKNNLQKQSNLERYCSISSTVNDESSEKSITIQLDDSSIDDTSIDDTFVSKSVVVSDLSDWTKVNSQPQEIKLLIDPVTGRMVFLNGLNPKNVKVSYYYGFSADIGGGFYRRKPTAEFDQEENICFSSMSASTSHFSDNGGGCQFNYPKPVIQNMSMRYAISKVPKEMKRPILDNGVISSYIDSLAFTTIQEALKRWESDMIPNAIFEIVDNETYEENLKIQLDSESNIKICSSEQHRAVIRGSISILGGGGGNVTLDGLLIDSTFEGSDSSSNNISTSNYTDSTNNEKDGSRLIYIDKEAALDSLVVRHCTLVPRGIKSVFIDGGNDSLLIDIDHSISGEIYAVNSRARITISNSIIDGKRQRSKSIDKLEPHFALYCNDMSNIRNSTIFGPVVVGLLDATNTIFTDPISVRRRQDGKLNCCYLPPGSRKSLPRTNRCVEGTVNQSTSSPLFTSETYGHGGYAQLHDSTPNEIFEGADNDSEMGVFNLMYQPQKIKIISNLLKEYLRFGLELGIFLVT